MKATENNIEETLHSLEGIQRVDVSFSVKEAIKKDFKNYRTDSITITQKWMIAASIVVLLGINLVSVVEYSKKKSVDTALASGSKNVVYKEYFSSDY